jgi:trimethylamine:corrinoid methyltransferase-like protein
MIELVLGGISTEEERLAVEAIERVGPGGNFLIDDLTLKLFQDGAVLPQPAVARNQ